MKAIVYTKYGTSDVLELKEVDKPVPKDNEVLVKIHSTTVTPMDWRFRSGKNFFARLIMSGLLKPRNPILGIELSGEITEIGLNVKLFKGTEQIFAATKGGGYAEYICLPENMAVKKPSNMTYEEASSVPFGATTAYHFLVKAGKIKKGQKVLVNGASGGVGIFAVQLAKYFGAEVTGVCSTTNLEMVRFLGVDKVIDYTKEDFTRNNETYDIIFDVVGKNSFPKCKKILNKKGIYLTTEITFSIVFQMLSTSITGGKKAKFTMPPFPPVDYLKILKGIIEERKLKTVIGERYPLSEIVEAHKYAEKGHAKGKVVITLEHNNKT